jgi:hypothetical protein
VALGVPEDEPQEQFRNLEEEKHLPLEAATEHGSEDVDVDSKCICVTEL